MDHFVIPLDSVHVTLVDELADGLAAAAGDRAAPDGARRTSRSLPTPASNGVRPRAAIAAAIADLPPFVVHAHGYGLFAGHGSGDLNVHVPVVRTESLAALHRVVLDATHSTGAVIAGWTEPDAWTPHITLLSLSSRPDAPWSGCHVAGGSPPPELADPGRPRGRHRWLDGTDGVVRADPARTLSAPPGRHESTG